MKLYTYPAPNPRRVEIFLDEKGVDVPRVMVDVMEGETRKPEFLAKNSLGELPVLELDDGTLITESLAICRYLDAIHPQKPLMGSTPLQTARIEMWTRRMELHVMGPISDVGLHLIPIFADKVEQMPDYAESQKRLQAKKWAWLDAELSDGRTYVCDDAFSVADITGMAALIIADFMNETVPAEHKHVKRWETAVRARPSWTPAAQAA